MKVFYKADYDVVVIGATSAGIAAAVAAARLGHSVALVEYHPHVGGMAASGLGKSDVEHRHLIGGLFLEFVRRVRSHYADLYGAWTSNFKLCRDGYYYEPSVAEIVFESMINEHAGIEVYKTSVLVSVERVADSVHSVGIRRRISGQICQLSGRVFVDATYEGDLYAMAGCPFRLGRESRDEFGEPHAGVVFYDYETGEFLPETTGAADDRLPAYTYRLCLTSDPDNSHVLEDPPPEYNREEYIPYLDDLAAGRLGPPQRMVDGRGYFESHFDTLVRALSMTELPNQKFDTNINPRPLAFPFPEQNIGYVHGTWTQRERILERHRNLTLGLIYFLQNDKLISDDHRALARKYHLPLDEFTDNQHFPFQLYIREARRLRGCYTLTEHDVTASGAVRGLWRHSDAVAVGEFPIDSFPVRKRRLTDTKVLEGYLGMLDSITRPYQIPYGIMIPESVDGIVVPVAASATHVAYSSVRMEPTWMAMGHAAGVAAHLAITHDCVLRKVSVDRLQDLLRQEGQVIDPEHDAISGLPGPCTEAELSAGRERMSGKPPAPPVRSTANDARAKR